MPGSIKFFQVSTFKEEAPLIWAACTDGLLALVNPSGTVRKVIQLPAKITSLAVAPDLETYKTVAAVVGLDNDLVIAFDSKGNQLWQEKAEVSQRFWLNGHWRAPWFTDVKRGCHGVLALRFIRWQDDKPAEIAFGRACTVEMRRLDGSLIKRLGLEWGNRSTLAESVYTDGKKILLAGNWHRALSANMFRITDKYEAVKWVYSGLPGGYTRIHGQGQGYRFPILTDLDGDGNKELILALCGSWNDLVVYDAKTQKAKWARVFGASGGPQWSNSSYMSENPDSLVSSVQAGNVNDDPNLEIAVGARSGWRWLFDAVGRVVWAHHTPEAVTGLAIAEKHVYVGFSNGIVNKLDTAGEPVQTAKLAGAITQITAIPGCLICASDSGQLVALPFKKTDDKAVSAKTSASKNVIFNGKENGSPVFPTTDNKSLQCFRLADDAGRYSGKAVVSFAEQGSISICLDAKEIAAKTVEQPGLLEIPLGPLSELSANGIITIWTTPGVKLESMTFNRLGPCPIMGVNPNLPPKKDWLICQGEDCLPSSTGKISKLGGYLKGAKILNVPAEPPTVAKWEFQVPQAGKYVVLLRYASSYPDLESSLMIDDKVVLPSILMPPTGGWGYAENHWLNGVPGGIESSAFALELAKGPHVVGLTSKCHSFNLDWIALVPILN